MELQKNYPKFLFFLFFSSLTIRLLFFYAFLHENPCQLMYDAGHYHTLALSLAEGKGVVTAGGVPQFYRLPGYPAFLAGGYKVFNGSIEKTLLLQIILNSFIPLLVVLLGLILFPGAYGAGLLAGVICALHPGFIIFSGLVMSETCFVFYFLLFLNLFFWGSFFSAGVVLGLASMIRPIGGPLVILSLLIFLVGFWHKKIQIIKAGVALVLGWVVVVVGWLLRNWALTGFIFFHTLPGYHFLNHLASCVVMDHEKILYHEAKHKMVRELDQRVFLQAQKQKRPLQEIEYCLIAERITKEIVKKYPLATLKHALKNMLKTTFSLYSSELLVIDAHGNLPSYTSDRKLSQMVRRFLFPQVTNLWIVGVIYFELFLWLLLLLGVLGFVVQSIIRKTHFFAMLQLFLWSGLFITLSFACGFARLRLPIEPFFIIVASIFWIEFLKGRRESE